ncbi:hypothetical protein TWF694_006464 [Orbilia ellipsospora]|uniref:Subtelomeric hrmA-associated cluster protein AFUB-079030/YDR124W-like helical bundle domain-containing protein n=1 Tax=Orbilia ellipsospora TaxID=2528407 RepID=A0AAV9XKA2_9PEZI
MVNRDITPQVIGALRHNFPIETQFAVIAVTIDGKISIHASELLKPFCDKWYHDGVRSDALTAVASIAGRKRSHVAASAPTGHPSNISVGGIQSDAIQDQMATSPVEEPMGAVDAKGEHPSPSPAPAGRPRKKQRRASTDSQLQAVDPPATIQKKSRNNRKEKPEKTPHIKQEPNDLEVEEGEKDWETMDSYLNVSKDEEPLEDEPREEEVEEELPMVPLCIGDEAAVANYLWRKFVELQQLDCKVIAKAWVKVIEPKKQAHSPYNGGDATRPWWWPVDAPHKEPDHLLKNARIRVLISCISDQLVPISQLRAATDETSLRPSQKEILHEMYDVMELDQKMRAGNLDRDHVRFVRPFVKGNKRRKKRNLKNPQPASKGPLKRSNMKKEAETRSLGRRDSDMPLSDLFKTKEEDAEDAAVANHTFSPEAMELAVNSQLHPGDPHVSTLRRPSVRAIGVASQSETSEIFSSGYIPSAAVKMDPKGGDISDSSQQPFEWTPSPTTLSPVYTQITSPGISCTIIAPVQATSTCSQPTGYNFADIDTTTIYSPIVQGPIATSPNDITMLGTNDSDMFGGPVMGPSAYNSDAYTTYALQDVQAFHAYPRPPFYPDSGIQDTNMINGTNGTGFNQPTFR